MEKEQEPPIEGMTMTLRCLLDGLLLPGASVCWGGPALIAYDGDESFAMEGGWRARFYEVVAATSEEWLGVEHALTIACCSERPTSSWMRQDGAIKRNCEGPPCQGEG